LIILPVCMALHPIWPFSSPAWYSDYLPVWVTGKLEFNSQGRDFYLPSCVHIVCRSHPPKGNAGCFPWIKRSAKLTTRLHLVQSQRMGCALPSFRHTSLCCDI
jgi:hypothetical protein